jgi:hypothetical protein
LLVCLVVGSEFDVNPLINVDPVLVVTSYVLCMLQECWS